MKSAGCDFSIQKQRYFNFWDQRFPRLLEEFFEEKLRDTNHSAVFPSINPPESVTPSVEDISEEEKENSASAFLRRSNLKKLYVDMDIGGKKRKLLFGEIPALDDTGLFCLDGITRAFVGYLGKPPGPEFSRAGGECKIYFRPKVNRCEGVSVIIKDSKSKDKKDSKPALSVKRGYAKLDKSKMKRIFKSHYKYFDDKYLIRGLWPNEKPIYGDFPAACRIGAAGRRRAEEMFGDIRKEKNPDADISRPADSSVLTANDIVAAAYLLDGRRGGKYQLSPYEKHSLANRHLYLIDDFLEEEAWAGFEAIWHYLTEAAKKWKKSCAEEFFDSLEDILNTKRDCRALKTFPREIMGLFVSHPLSRIVEPDNLLEISGYLRRVSLADTEDSPSDKELYHDRKARDIHWSHYGRLCPIDTPQGDDIGLIYSLAKDAIVEDGVIKAPHRKVVNGKITDGTVYLSPSEEKKCWIAYGGQESGSKPGGKVSARKGTRALAKRSPRKISYADFSPDQPFSWAAMLVPFLCHNDANRALMASNSMRQALQLTEKETPWIKTGYEKKLVKESGFKDGSIADGTIKDGEFAFGKNLCVGYMSYKGLNFEDAIVISDVAAQKLKSAQYRVFKDRVVKEYIDVARHRPVVKKEYITNDEIKWSKVTAQPHCKDTKKYGDDGIIREGIEFAGGDILVRKIVEECEGERAGKPRDASLVAPRGSGGVVEKVEKIELVTGDIYITIKVRMSRVPKVGDKLANRHGGKGVISSIIPENEMPYYYDEKSTHKCAADEKPHRHLEVILNPLGVFSRLNIGQLFETHLGMILSKSGKAGESVTHHPLTPYSWERLKKELEKAGLNEDGKLQVWYRDGDKWADAGRIVVGYQYIMRLEHIASEKLNSRGSPGAKYYDTITSQPTRGKEKYGGQRAGEMEVWALAAHDADSILKEILTLKSDNPQSVRDNLKKYFASAGEQLPAHHLPEFLRVLAVYLRCVGIDVKLFPPSVAGASKSSEPLRILPEGDASMPPDILPSAVATAQISVMDLYDESCKKYFGGEVDDVVIGYDNEGYKDGGLFSQTVFGPLKSNTCPCGIEHPDSKKGGICPKCKAPIGPSQLRNYRMGYIKLPFPVVNPLFIKQVAAFLDIHEDKFKKVLFGRRPLPEYMQADKQDSKSVAIEKKLRGDPNFSRYLIKYLPVLPPAHRPYTIVTGGAQLRICGDFNAHYLDILSLCPSKNNDKNKKKKKKKRKPPRYDQLQRAVALLFDVEAGAWGRHRESLISRIAGNELAKEGFFRGHLLGKRADYSGRAVIVPGPDLKMDECRLPLSMVAEIYGPMLEKRFGTDNPDEYKKKLERWKKGDSITDDELKAVNGKIKSRPVLINRQPSLHNLNIQAFYPSVTLESAIYFHPLVTAGYNADHDGDTVAVHVPVSREACEEAKRMLASNNIISLADGSITANVSQDIAMGIYRYTQENEHEEAPGQSELERELFGDATGRIKKPVKKGELQKLLMMAYNKLLDEHRGDSRIADTRAAFAKKLDWVKEKGFACATQSGFSLAIDDFVKGKVKYSSIEMLLESAARGDDKTLGQIIQKRGKMQRIGKSGKFSVDGSLPEIESSLLKGMNLGEIFISCYGSRKTLVDKKLGVADCGYITRQFMQLLCDVRLADESCRGESSAESTVPDIVKQAKLFERHWRYCWRDISEIRGGAQGKDVKDAIDFKKIFKCEFNAYGACRPTNFLFVDGLIKQFEDFAGALQSAQMGYMEFCCKDDIWPPFASFIKKRMEKIYDANLVEKVFSQIRGTIDAYWIARKQFCEPNIITCNSADGVCPDCYYRFGEADKAARLGKATGIIAAQSLGEPLTQNVMRTFHTGGAVSKDVAVIDEINNIFEGRHPSVLKLEWAIKKIPNQIDEIEEAQYGVVDALYVLYKELRASIDIRHIELLVRQLTKWYMASRTRPPQLALKRAALGRHPSGDWLAAASFEKMRECLFEAASGDDKDSLEGHKQKVMFGKIG